MIRENVELGGPTDWTRGRSPLVVDPGASFQTCEALNMANPERELMSSSLSDEERHHQLQAMLHLTRARSGGYGSCGKRSADFTFPTSSHSHYYYFSLFEDDGRRKTVILGSA
jgi:hypothetical protein